MGSDSLATIYTLPEFGGRSLIGCLCRCRIIIPIFSRVEISSRPRIVLLPCLRSSSQSSIILIFLSLESESVWHILFPFQAKAEDPDDQNRERSISAFGAILLLSDQAALKQPLERSLPALLWMCRYDGCDHVKESALLLIGTIGQEVNGYYCCSKLGITNALVLAE